MILTLAFALATASAQDFRGLVYSDIAFDTAWDRDGEDRGEGHLWVSLAAKGTLVGRSKWFLEVRPSWHGLVGDDVEGWWAFDPGECGISVPILKTGRFEIGWLAPRWGSLDLLPVGDFWGARDFRSGLWTPVEFQRLTAPRMLATRTWGPVNIEAVAGFGHTQDLVWLRDTDWSLMRQGMTEAQIDEMLTWEGDTAALLEDLVVNAGDTLSTLDPSFRRGLDEAVATKNTPQEPWESLEGGLRVRVTAGAVDVGVGIASHTTRQPNVMLDPYLATLLQAEVYPSADELETAQAAIGGGVLTVEWPRSISALVEAAAIIGPLSLRSAATWRSANVVRRHWGNSAVRPQLDVGLAIDYLRGSSLQVTFEARYSEIFDPPDDLMFVLRRNGQLAGGIRAAFVQDRLTIELGGAFDIGFVEGMIRPTVSYRINDWVAVHGRGLFLLSTREAPSDVPEALTWDGGLMGYFDQNDAVSVGVDVFF